MLQVMVLGVNNTSARIITTKDARLRCWSRYTALPRKEIITKIHKKTPTKPVICTRGFKSIFIAFVCYCILLTTKVVNVVIYTTAGRCFFGDGCLCMVLCIVVCCAECPVLCAVNLRICLNKVKTDSKKRGALPGYFPGRLLSITNQTKILLFYLLYYNLSHCRNVVSNVPDFCRDRIARCR